MLPCLLMRFLYGRSTRTNATSSFICVVWPWGVCLHIPSSFSYQVDLQHRRGPSCPLGNIDIMILAHENSFPLLALAIQSIDVFMKCRNIVHIVLPPKDVGKAVAWLAERPGFAVHGFTLPVRPGIPGCVHQQLIMMIADEYAAKAQSRAEWMMFMDTDSVLGMPVTCKSLFDGDGRVYQVAWPITLHDHFREPCERLLGFKCHWCYMATFPFVMPLWSFEPMRRHIQQRIAPDASSFLEAFYLWAQRVGHKVAGDFSQFVVMGSYMAAMHPNTVSPIHCLAWPFDARREPAETRACLQFVPAGVHLGWDFGHLDPAMGREEHGYRVRNPGDFSRYGNKYGPDLIRGVQDIIQHGVCLRERFANKSLPPFCAAGRGPRSVHKDLDIYYRRRALNWSLVEEVFHPDEVVWIPVCTLIDLYFVVLLRAIA